MIKRFDEAVLGKADWIYDADLFGDGSNIDVHIPCCSKSVNGKHCGNGPLDDRQIEIGNCGEHNES